LVFNLAPLPKISDPNTFLSNEGLERFFFLKEVNPTHPFASMYLVPFFRTYKVCKSKYELQSCLRGGKVPLFPRPPKETRNTP